MLNEMFYQVGLIDAAGRGLNQQLREAILAAAGDRGSALAEAFRFFEDDEVTGMRDNGPRLSVYFGGPGYRKDLDTVVENQLTAGNLVIPVVPELVGFHSQVPASLAATNGMALPPGGDLAALVSLTLEDFRLLRSSRRVFVSYKRTESQAAATGLYHELDANSFDAFLDTHSIRQGDPFQERLWHRMADSDVIVLLNTATVLTSGWVAQELDRADAMGISVLQVLWPGVARDPRTRMFEPIYLEPEDFESSSSAAGSSLTAAAMARLLTAVERLRARALASREARLLKVLCGMASERGIAFSVPRPGCVDFCTGTRQLKRVFLGVGIPDGPTYHDAVETPSEQVPERVWLMYDTLPIAPFHQRYLDWLGPMLPVGTLKLAGVEDFLSGIGVPMTIKPVFVSASVPDLLRDPQFFTTSDNAAIRDAITALVQVVTPERQLVFGGHPAITPMVARVAASLGTLDNVVIYQSALFQPFFPQENAAFRTLIMTPATQTGYPGEDRKASLATMRQRMIHDQEFAAAFFVGGMEGVLEEFFEIRGLDHPPPCFPVATTGGAALILARDHETELRALGAAALFNGYGYYGIFRRLLTSLVEQR